MSATFTPQEMAEATGGYWFNGVTPGSSLALSTDTRIDNQGNLFVALAGERFDAHDFLTAAVDSGCNGLCVENNKLSKIPENIPVLIVDNTLKAYQALGHWHRKRFPDLKVIGITGSVGKTSVKEMIRAIGEAAVGAEHVLYTLGNTNNQVGAVQNLLRLKSSHRWAVLEMGTSSPGEIEVLTRMIAPQVALINTIAPCHLELLGSLRGVAEEKSKIFEGLLADGSAIIPIKAPESGFLAEKSSRFTQITFGTDNRADIWSQWQSGSLEGGKFILHFPIGSYQVSWNLSGSHQAVNGAAAAAAATALGVPPETIVRGLQNTTLPGMRMKTTLIGGVKYINDAYNANPASMSAALAQFSDFPGLHLVLGGMRELGEQSLSAHMDLINYVAEKFPHAAVIYIGPEFAETGVNYFADAQSAEPVLANSVKSGDMVFAKGSRGNAVELTLPPAAR